MARPRRLIPLLAVGLLGLAVAVALLHAPLLRSMARWLWVEDRPERADAIVVLAGGTPRREQAAAALWKDGWAPRVVISRPFQRPELQELIDLGVRRLDLQGEARAVLEKSGVPPDRIIALPEVSTTTEPELALVRDAARRLGYRRVLLVTSPEHTRRVRLTWSRQSHGGPEGLVIAAAEDFPFEDWWRRRRAAEAVLHEYLGLLVLALGVSHLFK